MGRRPATENLDEKAFQESLQREAKGGLPKTIKYLRRVIDGKETDTVWNVKTGQLITKPIPHEIRVKAAKVYGDLVANKVVPDKRQVKKDPDSYDVSKAVEEVAKKKERERKAGGGKILNLPERTA